MKVTGAKAMIKSLENEGIEVIFGYPGATICPFYDALLDTDIKHILTRYEQAAAHAANGYSRVSGKVGVCVATSGPGATNLITGIATAYMDSIPLVAITGQVQTEQIGKDVFQEVDITGATAPFCKHNYLVKDVNKIPRIFKEAFYIAKTGRPGPVLIDIPVDVQTSELEYNYPDEVVISGYNPLNKGNMMQIKRAVELIKKSKSPVICAGGGIISSGASNELNYFAEKCEIPVTTTLMGIGSLSCENKYNLGMLGSHGVKPANFAINNADLIIIIGARVGDRAMAAAKSIDKKANIIHIDIDPAEIGKNLGTNIPIVGDAKTVLKQLNELAIKGDVESWNKRILSIKENNIKEFDLNKEFVNPKYLLSKLYDIIGDDLIVTTEVGQNQIWAANYFMVRHPKTFITSGGLGTMGYGLPAAIGIKVYSPSSTVVNISGDGSFQMNMQELATIKQNNLDVKEIIFNNKMLGMVRELQTLKYNKRYSQVELGGNPDFVKVFSAYGFSAERITKNDEIESAIKRMFENKGTYMIECMVDPYEGTP